MPAKVLVADDSPTIRRRATTTLSEAGYEVTCVEDGQAAWALLQDAPAFSVLLCDILMPGMDGYELCRRVKSEPRLASLPVLLLRGTFEPWDQAKAVDAGADGYVTKPFDAEALLSTLGEVLADTGGAALPVAAAVPAAGGGPEPEPLHAALHPAPVGFAEPPPRIAEPEPEPEPELVAAPESDSPFGAGSPLEAGPVVSGNPFDMEPEPAAADALVFDPGPGAAAEPEAAPLDLGSSPFGDGGAAPVPPAPVPPAPDPWALSEREPVAPPAPAPPPPSLPATPLSVTPAPFVERPSPPPPTAASASVASVAFGGATELDEATLDKIADRVAARLVGRDIERIAWEVVPDVAEALIRKRLSEIEAQLGEE